MNNKKFYIERIAAWIAAVILLQTLYFKFTGHPDSVMLFEQLGAEPFGRIGLGIIELLTVIFLILPKTSHLGAILGIGIMLGAVFSHIFVIGVNYNHDGGVLFSLALITLLCSIVVLVLRKDKLLGLLKK
ncbi:DoxX-like family protein [Zhouia amylolytica]|uniref:DoxX family protein n=2 Tax=Zhouia amylolytica TaxID=376730 RepID=W2UPD9_9FLAO|nr:DoxX family protein [Zhouia amylolytica]ETN96050.1 hypothetical protein P278_17720 [Zhouia amylolytica AD3]MCQ0111336.1 DoxX family protein [Zhouia amylolytica]SFS50224.1 DoxX-like family protein [Zhouia amylolytica]